MAKNFPTIFEGEEGLERLVEHQQEEIESISQRIELWKKYKNDYQGVKTLINTIKDTVRHPYNVPVAGTQLAFIPGHIIHTNELTVLLGDNYFALRSTKQANDIINRRLVDVNDKLKKSEEAKKQTEDWLKVAKEHKREKEEFVEIIETVP